MATRGVRGSFFQKGAEQTSSLKKQPRRRKRKNSSPSDSSNCPQETAAFAHTYPPSILTIKPLTFFVWGGVGGKHQSNAMTSLGHYFYFYIPSSVTSNTLQVTLAYTDYPSEALDSQANKALSTLKNALDVQVEGPVTSNAACTTSSSCTISRSTLYIQGATTVNPHATVKITTGLIPASVYRIYVGPSNSQPLLYPQPFALVASFSAAFNSPGGTLKPYVEADKPTTQYTLPGRPASYISSTSTTIIAVFSVVGAILAGLVGVIYFSHKQVSIASPAPFNLLPPFSPSSDLPLTPASSLSLSLCTRTRTRQAARLEEEEIARRIGGAMASEGGSVEMRSDPRALNTHK